MGAKMTSVLKKFITGNTVVKSYDQSPYPVEISPEGAVAVDAQKLVDSEPAKRQIAAVRELRIEKAK
jgi:hypothetical protein